jgi:hypothetical protein
MAVAGSVQVLGQVFQSPLKFMVPDFQRNYAWEDDQIDSLLEDISTGADSVNSHFIGSLIIRIDPNEPRVAQVIDGQQRLTTIFMTVACLRDFVVFTGDGSGILEIEGQASINVIEQLNRFLFALDDETYQLSDRFEAHPMIAEMFSNQILAGPLPNRPQLPSKHHQYSMLLRKAHKRIKRWPSEEIERLNEARKESGQDPMSDQEKIAWVLRILNVLSQRITLLQISTQDEMESFDIFMSLNSTGKNLGPADLVKSHIFSKLTLKLNAAEKSKRNRELTEQWQGVLENLDEGDIDQFLRHYLLANQSKDPVRGKDVFPRFKDLLDVKKAGYAGSEEDLAQDHLDRIITASSIYQELLEGNALNSFRGVRSLKTLREIGSSYRVLLLSVFDSESKLKEDERERLALKTEAFNLRWVLAGGNAQILENFYQLLAGMVREGKDLNLIIKALDQKMPKNEELEPKFQAEAPSSSYVKLVLARIEQEISKDEKQYDAKKVHLEFIAPPPPTKGFQAWLAHMYPGEVEKMELEYATTVSQWGNITLVDKAVPLVARGGTFAEKSQGSADYEGYASSTYGITRNLAELEDWDRFKIKDRNTWIGECVMSIWPADGQAEDIKPFN